MARESSSFHPFQGRPPFGLEELKKGGEEIEKKFPSLSGKSSIRTSDQGSNTNGTRRHGFHPFQGRAPFGLLTGGSYYPRRQQRFHPFQGRPSFGRQMAVCKRSSRPSKFPSLSGKTSIRTEFITDPRGRVHTFPSLSGKTSIRT